MILTSKKQTHIRVFEHDKKVLDFIMRKNNIKSQAEAFRILLRRSKKKRGKK